ncbi:orotidine-5'-phosphate decarboxylase [Candidatus Micrarchaeota archaeon]|nr:orotidine-5'-phosphate decarboxylase [Candidatus Micrarchaeota archaeon]
MFRDRLEKEAQMRQSRLILALDEPDYKKAFTVLRKSAKYLLAVKLHPEMPAIWGKKPAQVVDKFKQLVPFVILDAKLADIGSSNAFKSEYHFLQGYDAIICHGFPGKESVQAIQTVAQSPALAINGPRGVFLLAAMTSPGHLFAEATAQKLAQMAQELNVDGIVAPGNQYDLLAKIHSFAPGIPILSPGIGTQGGDAKLAAQSGTRYAIVGRSILSADKPGLEARRTCQQINDVLTV